MLDRLSAYFADSKELLAQIALLSLTVFATLAALRVLGRYLSEKAKRPHFDDRRLNAISKLGRGLILVVALALCSNILGFGVEGIFVATSSLFALIGIAFFAVWSILSNVTSSVILYFSFPFRIGDRISIENAPEQAGILRDITLFYLKIETDKGAIVSVPANVAMQRIITTEKPGSRALAKTEEASAEIRG